MSTPSTLRVLAIETAATRGAAVALLRATGRIGPDGELDGSTIRVDGRRSLDAGAGDRPSHARRIGPELRDLLADAGIAGRDIDAVAVDVGPGSYTGLRVGVAAAKGFALAADAPLKGVGALDAIAVEAGASLAPGTRLGIAVASSAREVYLALFELDGASRPNRVAGPVIRPRGEAADWVRANASEATTAIAGDAAVELAEALGTGASTLAPDTGAPDVETIGREAIRALTLEGPDDANALAPLYLRLSEAEERLSHDRSKDDTP